MTNPAQNPYTSSLPADQPGGQPGAQLSRGEIDQLIRVNQIITFALANGIVVITAVMGYLTWSNNDGEFKFAFSGDDFLFPLIGFVMVGATIPFGLIVKRVIFQQAREQAARLQPSSSAGDDELVVSTEVMGRIASGTIIGQAAAEGGAVLNAVLMMIGDNFIHLIPIGVAFLAVIVQVPTYGRLCNWLRQ